MPPSTPRQSLTTSVPNGAPSVSRDAAVTPIASTTAELNTPVVLKTLPVSMSHPPLPRQQPQRPARTRDRPQTLPARPSTLALVAALLRPAVAVPRPARLLPSSSARLTACLLSLLVSSEALLFFCKKCSEIVWLFLLDPPFYFESLLNISHSFCNQCIASD